MGFSVRSLALYSVLYGGSAALLRLVGFVIFISLARSLSTDDYANFGLLYALQQGLALFAMAGIVEAVVGILRQHREPEQLARLFAVANTAFLAMVFVTAVLSAFIWLFFFRYSNVGIVAYASVFICGLLLAFATFQAQIVRLDEKHRWSLLFSTFPQLVTITSGFLAFVLFGTVLSFFLGSALGVLVSLLCLLICRVGVWRVKVRTYDVFHILRRAVPFIVVGLLGWLSGYGNNYIIDQCFTKDDVAKFTFALSLCTIMLLIANALNQVWSPRFYRVIHEMPFDEVEEKNSRFFLAVGLLLGAIGGFVIISFPSAMRMLGGNLTAYSNMNLELSLLFSAYIILIPWWHCQNHFLSHGMGNSILRVTISTSIVGIIFLVILMWLLGPVGIYIGFALQMIVRSAGILLLAKRNWPVRVSWAGIAFGLIMICGGYVLSCCGVTLIVSLPLYSVIVVLIGAVIFANDLKWLFINGGTKKRLVQTAA